jgi:ABC-type glycerol-3-phosphate transport system permease component
MPRLGTAVSRAISRTILYAVIIVMAVGFMLPYAFALTSSLKTHAEIHLFPPRLFPARPYWDNYPEVFRQVTFARFIWNSIVVVVLGGFGQVITSAIVGFGFARIRFPGRDILFTMVLSTMILPWAVTIIPQFMLYKALKWLDTLNPLIVPNYLGGGAFFIFLFRQFFMTIPLVLDEAATLDGASRWGIFTKVVLPLSRPAFATVAIFSFLAHWNDFFGPLIYLNTESKFTVALGLRLFQRTASLGGRPVDQLLMAASIITTLPIVVLFFFAQKTFVQGIVMTGIKG